MESFTEQFKASALKVATVVQSLATNGLDEMAAIDEYVQSDGYNNHNNSKSGMNQNRSISLTTTTNTSTSSIINPLLYHQQQLQLPMMTQQQQQQQQQQQSQFDPIRIQQQQNPHNTAATIITKLQQKTSCDPPHTIERATSDSESENDDPILSLMMNQKPISRQNNATDISVNHEGEGVKKTRTNRFMDDIEFHLSKPDQDYKLIPIVSVVPVGLSNDDVLLHQNNNNNNDTTSSLTSWLSSTIHSFGIPTTAVSSSLLVTTKKVTKHNNMRLDDGITTAAPLLSRSKHRSIRENMNNNSQCENVVELVSSATVLDKAELEQLEQLRLLKETTPYDDGSTNNNNIQQLVVYKILVHIQNHRREWFIAITLIVCVFIYFNFRDQLIY